MRRTDRRFPAPISLVAILLTAGCVSALREPPPLEDMAAAARGQGGGPFAEAKRLWNQRTLESVRTAAESYQASITDPDVQLEALIGAARARIWVAEHHEDPDARLAEAAEAVHLGQWCGRVNPDESECDYLLALALGLQARERHTTAIDALDHMVGLLQSSIERAPLLDHAGPHRVLALVYIRAPGWPTGPGDIELGHLQAQRAVELDPTHPPNQMALGEAQRELGDLQASRTAYREAERQAAEQAARNVPDAAEWLEQARRALERLEQR